MKRIILLIFLFAALALNSNAQSKRIVTAQKPSISNEAEMKTYILVFLKSGPTRDQSEEIAAEIQKGHLEFLARLAEEGFLIMAGPLKNDQDIRGILVLNTTETDDARIRLEEDPAIKAGRLIAEYHQWYTKSGTITLP